MCCLSNLLYTESRAIFLPNVAALANCLAATFVPGKKGCELRASRTWKKQVCHFVFNLKPQVKYIMTEIKNILYTITTRLTVTELPLLHIITLWLQRIFGYDIYREQI